MYAKALCFSVLGLSACLLTACGANVIAGTLSYSSGAQAVLANYQLTGDTAQMHDPSIIRQGSAYYAFTSDFLDANGNPPASFLEIRCSKDKVRWKTCGSVFAHMPVWIAKAVPAAQCLWAPDVSYFGGLYHLYYAASSAGSQQSAIGLVTNTTLDASDPDYKWIDRGVVLRSKPGGDFNAIDPNVLVDSDGTVWLTYGSYWTGIKQRELDPETGMLSSTDTTRYNLARRPGIADDPIEGASLVHHGGFYYLFVSVDHCCDASPAKDNYKEAVGRSTSPHGPFVDVQGTAMLHGGGTVIIEGNAGIIQGDGAWAAPGGGTAHVDPDTGESVIVFHALKMNEHAAPYLWLKSLAWQNDWPVVQ